MKKAFAGAGTHEVAPALLRRARRCCVLELHDARRRAKNVMTIGPNYLAIETEFPVYSGDSGPLNHVAVAGRS